MELEETSDAVTIVERRAPWREEHGPEWTRSPVAQLRYTVATCTWTLYRRDEPQRWHRYVPLKPSADITVLLDEIDRDPTCIFWG